MKPRTALHILVGLLISAALVFFASNLQAGNGSSLAEMVNAQRHTPVLWVVDGCAAMLVAALWWYAVMLNNFQSFSDFQARQHHEQLDDMIERTADLERVNAAYADRIDGLEAEITRQFRDLADQVATLEAASDARRKVFEIETTRISEQAYLLVESHTEANTRQIQAVSMAYHFQRGELRRLRHEVRELQHELAPDHALRLAAPRFIETATELEAAPYALAAPPASFRPDSDADVEELAPSWETGFGLLDPAAAIASPDEVEVLTERDPVSRETRAHPALRLVESDDMNGTAVQKPAGTLAPTAQHADLKQEQPSASEATA